MTTQEIETFSDFNLSGWLEGRIASGNGQDSKEQLCQAALDLAKMLQNRAMQLQTPKNDGNKQSWIG